MLHRWMQQESVSKLPAGFRRISEVRQPRPRRQSEEGRHRHEVRSGIFPLDEVRRPYARAGRRYLPALCGGGVPSEQEYRTFQDYIFRYLVREGGRLHLPVHIHSAVGIGDYFNLSESNIMNLENILRDPRYSSTVFVMIHGGYPYERQAIWLAAMQNVYLDSSLMELDHVSFGVQALTQAVAGDFSRIKLPSAPTRSRTTDSRR